MHIKVLKNKPWTIGILTAIHAFLSVGLMGFTFSAGMDRLDTGAPPTLFEKSAVFVSNVLFWPIVYPLTHWAPFFIRKVFGGLFGYLPMVVNSLLWGAGGWWLLKHRSNKKRSLAAGIDN